MQGDHDVGGLDVAMDDSFLVRMLHCVANTHKQFKSLSHSQAILITKIGDFYPAAQFHDEVRPACFGGARIENSRDIGMVHQGQSLSLYLEPCDYRFSVHPRFNDLQGDTAANWSFLVGHINDPATPFSNLLKQLVRTDPIGFLRFRFEV
jgi:hypothetical protein